VIGPLCAMWQGRCGRPAHLIVETTVRIGTHDEPLTWLVCDATPCWDASRRHAETFGLRYTDSRRLTLADIEEITSRVEVAA
jgi:hypothetical protein